MTTKSTGAQRPVSEDTFVVARLCEEFGSHQAVERALLDNPSASSNASIARIQRSVRATLRLRSEGCTIPFVVRYRRHVTNASDEALVDKVFHHAEEFVALSKKKQRVKEKILALPQQQPWFRDLLRDIDASMSIDDVKELSSTVLESTGGKSASLASKALREGFGPLADRIWSTCTLFAAGVACFVAIAVKHFKLSVFSFCCGATKTETSMRCAPYGAKSCRPSAQSSPTAHRRTATFGHKLPSSGFAEQ